MLGAIAGAVAAAIVALVIWAVADNGGDSSATAPGSTSSTTSTTVTTSTTTSAPTTSAPTTTTSLAPPPAQPVIDAFGVNVVNCPQGAASTSVTVTYTTRNAASVEFTIDDGAAQTASQVSGSAAVGPIPCDGNSHHVTMAAINDGLRATRDATVSVS
ncbi:MAG TPA: hypothetical protein VEP49_13155 [Acidimicrobiia bacterium]|nr:hypothetical protein [Acidimicrobiia bacterium]